MGVPEEAAALLARVAALSAVPLRAAVLVPALAALRGAFPLNGTYFQTNELFLVQHTAAQVREGAGRLGWDRIRTKNCVCMRVCLGGL